MRTIRYCLHTGLLLTAATLSVHAGNFSANFDSGALPPGSHTNANAAGGAYLELTGGVGDSGCLKLTKNINGQNGSFILDDLDSGQPIYGFDITFQVRIGGGTSTPADGMSLSVAPDLTDTSLFAEGGAGSGLRLDWDIYNNPDTPPSPQINVRSGPGGAMVAWKGYTISSITTTGTVATWWVPVHIRLNADGSLNFDYKGANVFTNFFVPGYQDLVNAGLPVRFGFGARTGGLNANQWIDNLQITTFTQPLVGLSQQPFSQTAQQGDDVQFDVRVGNTNGVTYQWFSNNVAIANATSQTLTISNAQAAYSGSQYKVTATGPNNSVTSSVVTLTVTDLAPPGTPQLSFNFDDGLVPAGTTNLGTAVVDISGGVTNSGALKLADAVNNENGAFVVFDPDGGLPVYGFTARFKTLIGGGTVPPADGFAFAFGNDIPADPTLSGAHFEEGAGLGTNLQVTFDIYNNDGIFGYYPGDEPQPAPSIDVRFGGQVLATRQLPISFMETGLNDDSTPANKDTIIQLNTDGTLNVVYHGALVFSNLAIPAFGSIAGGSYALAGRTGGLNDNIWFDNFELTTVTNSGTLRITTQPVSQTVLVNHAVTFSVGVNDATGVSYQWSRGGSAISGATTSSYTIPSTVIGDSGATFAVQVTKGLTTLNSSTATLTVVNLAPPVNPNYTFNFDDGLVPVNTAIYGNASVTSNGGVSDSGCLHLVDAVNSENSAFVIQPLYSGAQVSSIGVAFDVRVGGGTTPPADGWSFNFANNLPDGTVGGAENGNGNGLSVCMDIYGSLTDNPPAPNFNIRYKGALVSSIQIPYPQLETGSNYSTVLIRLDQDGKLYVSYGERVLYNGLQLPNYTFITGGKYALFARTGGLNENIWFDNVQIKATQSSGPLTVVTQPQNATVIAGQTATFNVTLSDPNGATYQWFKNNVSISGATASSYTTPPTVTGDNGAAFKVTANGPSGTATSSNAILTVVAPLSISNPQVLFDFNDCAVPAGTTVNGGAGGGYVDCSGGVTNSGVFKLTDAIGGESGDIIIFDFMSNAPVKAFTAYFAARIGGGTIPPADGWSFVWCSSNDLPSTVIFTEEGIGNTLIVSCDIFDNGNETPPAPDIDLRYKGNIIASRQLPYQQLETGDNFGDVFIRVGPTGIVDMQYNGMVIFNGVQLPNYTALLGGQFAIGGRTGGSNENQWFDNIAIAATPGLVPVPLGFAITGSGLRITWNGDGFKLQSTGSVAPPASWTDVPGASSGYIAPLTGTAQFFRLAPAQ